MARAPRAKVSATSGQGVSRLAYQKGYAMKRGDAPRVDAKFEKGETGQKRGYGKGKGAKPDKAGGFNVSYGDMFEPTDLADIQALGERRPPKGWNLGRAAAKKLKGG
jgi:hypothetical protein